MGEGGGGGGSETCIVFRSWLVGAFDLFLCPMFGGLWATLVALINHCLRGNVTVKASFWSNCAVSWYLLFDQEVTERK